MALLCIIILAIAYFAYEMSGDTGKTLMKYGLYAALALFVIACAYGLFSLATSENDHDKEDRLKNEYVKAVENGDFETARSKVQELQSMSDDGSWAVKESEVLHAWKFVNEKEIYALLSKTSRESDKRILFLYNSEDEERLPDMTDVLEVAITTDNEYLAEKLLRSGVGVNSKVAKATLNADMESLFELIMSKDPTLILDKEFAQSIKNSLGNQKYTEVLRISIENGLQELYDRDLPSRPAIGKVTSPWDCENYNDRISRFNSDCYKLILKSLELGDKDLTNKIFKLMKPSLEIRTNSNDFTVTESYDQINQARKMIQNGHN